MSTVHFEIKNQIATVTLDDPSTRNALTEKTGKEFLRVFKDLVKDKTVRAVVLTGANGAFSSGGHAEMLKAIGKQPKAKASLSLKKFYENFLIVRKLRVPVIAAVPGFAIGAGCCLALACDLRYGDATTKMGLNFARIGLSPGMGGSYFLQHLVGSARANELLLTARILTADEAHSWGLLNAVFAPGELLKQTLAIAETLAGLAPLALRHIKQSRELAETGSLKQIFAFDARAQAECLRTHDFAEGIGAMLQKRKPKFLGK